MRVRKEEEEWRVGGWVREDESEKGGGIGEGNSHKRKEKKREGVQDSL